MQFLQISKILFSIFENSPASGGSPPPTVYANDHKLEAPKNFPAYATITRNEIRNKTSVILQNLATHICGMEQGVKSWSRLIELLGFAILRYKS